MSRNIPPTKAPMIDVRMIVARAISQDPGSPLPSLLAPRNTAIAWRIENRTASAAVRTTGAR